MKRLLLCLTTVVVVLSGCAGEAAQREPQATSTEASADTTTAPSRPSAGSADPARKSVPPTVPTRLRLGDIDARVVPLRLTGSTLTPPDDPHVLGWWGKRAGARHGCTLLTGHTVHDGGGTFDNLEDTPLGAEALVSGHAYTVASVKVVSKSELARRAPALFAQTGHPRLVLVTCEGYDPATGHYDSNVVVTLNPTAAT